MLGWRQDCNKNGRGGNWVSLMQNYQETAMHHCLLVPAATHQKVAIVKLA